MGRVNKFTDGVFVDIVGNDKEKPAYERFMDLQSTLQKPKKDLNSLLSQYKKKISENNHLFDELGLMETIIMQMRSRDNLYVNDIKFNVVREYLYARIPFYRNDKDGKDIRVIVGLARNLRGKEDMVDIAKDLLISAMNNHINENIEKLKNLK